jgi:hypothetical protein
MDLLGDQVGMLGTDQATTAEPPAPAIAAAWQTLFLLVPVVHVPFEAIGALFADLGPARLGWLLADHAERLPARQARAVLGRVNHAVFAGDTTATVEPTPATNSAITTDSALTTDSAQRLAERTARYGTWLRSGRTALAGHAESAGPATQAGLAKSAESAKSMEGAGRIWVGTPLRVVRGLDRMTIDLRNDLAYDGLLVSDRD